MAFTATPLDGSTPALPMDSVVPDGTNTPIAVEGGPSKSSGGNTLAPVAVYQYDGYNVTQGAQADAAVISPASSGSMIALLKGLLTELIDIEAQTTGLPTALGQAAMANSLPVVVASDQSAIPASQSGTWTVQPGNTQNTTAWQVQFPNVDVTALASGARTTTQTVDNLLNKWGKGIRVTLDMTTVGTGSVTLSINAKDAVSGKTKLLLAGAAVTTNVTNVYIVYPGYAVVANVSANDVLPATFQLVVNANNANSATYSLGYSILL